MPAEIKSQLEPDNKLGLTCQLMVPRNSDPWGPGQADWLELERAGIRNED